MRLELRGVEAGYGDALVLRQVDLTVPSGAVTALLGPNGAGKTTLLRVASGLLRTSAGEIRLDGKRVERATPDRMAAAGICHVPEGRGVFRTLTVRENLLLHRRPDTADATDRVISIFPRLGERLGQVAGTMSGGEQQMLALARALVGDPGVILLDEVSMGLAPVVVDEIYAALALLADEGRTLVIVEQFVERALAISRYACILQRGEICWRGESTELRARDVASHYLGTAGMT